MVPMERIQELADRIAREFKPQKIILFGSHARGDVGKYSDVDVMVIMPFEGKGGRKTAEIRSRVRPHFGVDLLVRRPDDVERRVALGDSFLIEVMEEGKVLYESSRAGVGREG